MFFMESKAQVRFFTPSLDTVLRNVLLKRRNINKKKNDRTDGEFTKEWKRKADNLQTNENIICLTLVSCSVCNIFAYSFI